MTYCISFLSRCLCCLHPVSPSAFPHSAVFLCSIPLLPTVHPSLYGQVSVLQERVQGLYLFVKSYPTLHTSEITLSFEMALHLLSLPFLHALVGNFLILYCYSPAYACVASQVHVAA